jgi:chaperonin cofactor prefoldin
MSKEIDSLKVQLKEAQKGIADRQTIEDKMQAIIVERDSLKTQLKEA